MLQDTNVLGELASPDVVLGIYLPANQAIALLAGPDPFANYRQYIQAA